MQRVVVIIICLSLGACSNYTALRKPGWLKNPFSKSAPETASAAQNGIYPATRIWYCYTEPEQSGWDCQDHPAADQIRSPAAEARLPVAPVQQTSRVVKAPTPPPPTPVLVPEPEPEPVPATSTETNPAAAADPEPAVQVEATAGPVIPEFDAEITPLDRNYQFIMNHPVDYFAVQLIALETLADVSAFAAKQHIEDPLYARITTDGKIFVVLLLGIYPDRGTASDAVDQWSMSHQLKEPPWIRKLDTLMAAMKGASGDG